MPLARVLAMSVSCRQAIPVDDCIIYTCEGRPDSEKGKFEVVITDTGADGHVLGVFLAGLVCCPGQYHAFDLIHLY